MNEAEARQLLRDCGEFGGLEARIAGRRWRAVPGGWIVTGELQGWSFQLEPVAGGIRIAVSGDIQGPSAFSVQPGCAG